jgi:hypothetical protein
MKQEPTAFSGETRTGKNFSLLRIARISARLRDTPVYSETGEERRSDLKQNGTSIEDFGLSRD